MRGLSGFGNPDGGCYVTLYRYRLDGRYAVGLRDAHDRDIWQRKYSQSKVLGMDIWRWGQLERADAHAHLCRLGHYQTYLEWTDNNGCSGTSNILYTNITPPINANFSANATTVCAGQGVSFSLNRHPC